MKRRFNAILEWDADDHVWVTYVPSLDYLSTYGDTREEALERTREAILGYIEAAVKDNLPLPAESGNAELATVEVAV